MKHTYEEYNTHIQALMSLMADDYPNNFELIINSFSGEIRSTLQTLVIIKDKENPINSD